MLRRPPRSTLFPTRRSSDLAQWAKTKQEAGFFLDTRGLMAKFGEVSSWAMLRRPSYRPAGDRKSTRLNSSHVKISYAVFCLKKKKRYTLTVFAQQRFTYHSD